MANTGVNSGYLELQSAQSKRLDDKRRSEAIMFGTWGPDFFKTLGQHGTFHKVDYI